MIVKDTGFTTAHHTEIRIRLHLEFKTWAVSLSIYPFDRAYIPVLRNEYGLEPTARAMFAEVCKAVAHV